MFRVATDRVRCIPASDYRTCGGSSDNLDGQHGWRPALLVATETAFAFAEGSGERVTALRRAGSLMTELLQPPKEPPPPLSMLDRIQSAIREGMTLQQVATRLKCSPRTIHTYLPRLPEWQLVAAKAESGARLQNESWVFRRREPQAC